MFGSTERIHKLRERYMATVPKLDAERALLVTQSYKETEGQPMSLRRAKALKKYMEEKTVFISPGELLVGNVAKTYRGAVAIPEYTLDWLYEEFDTNTFLERDATLELMLIDDEDVEALRSIREYWSTRNITALMKDAVPDLTEEICKGGVLSFMWPYLVVGSVGHFACEWPKLLRLGFEGIKKEAEDCIAGLGSRMNGKDAEKFIFWKSILVMCDGMCAYGKRYAEAALKMAEEETDPEEKANLLEIAQVCEQVPAKPARTYREAVQAIWITHMIMQADLTHPGLSLGRLDQYLYPYYKADLEAGRITPTRGQELMEHLCLKLSEMNKLKNRISARNTGGYSNGQNITIGGQDKEGKDATNDVTYFILNSVETMSLHEPPISVRVWEKTPDDFYKRLMEVVKVGNGMPAIQNDDIIIPTMLNTGHSLEDSRNYTVIGCVEPSIPGLEYPCCGGPGSATYYNIANAVNVAFHNGHNALTGDKVAPGYGDLSTFASFEEARDAAQKTIEYFCDWYVTLTNIWDVIHAQYLPMPLVSCIMEPCIQNGKDVTAGGSKYNSTGLGGVGQTNAGDMLFVLKSLVFDEKKCTGKELLEAIDANWAGHETLHQEILAKVPHFGNDNDAVDEQTQWVCKVFANRINSSTGPRGMYRAGLYPVAIHVALGKRTAATLDGREATTPLCDSVGAIQGLDRNGPTAVMKSAAKIDHSDFGNGTLLNLKFTPTAVGGDEGTQKLADLTKAYFNMKGMHVQYNVMDAATLRKAQAEPEKYKNLVVRVAGYNAFFVELYEELQEEVIRRTEHAL